MCQHGRGLRCVENHAVASSSTRDNIQEVQPCSGSKPCARQQTGTLTYARCVLHTCALPRLEWTDRRRSILLFQMQRTFRIRRAQCRHFCIRHDPYNANSESFYTSSESDHANSESHRCSIPGSASPDSVSTAISIASSGAVLYARHVRLQVMPCRPLPRRRVTTRFALFSVLLVSMSIRPGLCTAQLSPPFFTSFAGLTATLSHVLLSRAHRYWGT